MSSKIERRAMLFCQLAKKIASGTVTNWDAAPTWAQPAGRFLNSLSFDALDFKAQFVKAHESLRKLTIDDRRTNTGTLDAPAGLAAQVAQWMDTLDFGDDMGDDSEE